MRALVRLSVIYFLVWVASAWLDGFHQGLVDTLDQLGGALSHRVTSLADSPWPTLAAFGAVLLLVRGLTAWLWMVPVSRDKERGPQRHPFPPRPLRIQLRFRWSRFFFAFVLEIFLLLSLFRAIPRVRQPAEYTLPDWLLQLTGQASAGASWLDAGIGQLVIHALAALLAWCLLEGFWTYHSRRALGDGFVRYQKLARPLPRLYLKLLFFAHLPMATFAVVVYGHGLAPLVTVVSLASHLLALLIAATVTLWLERRNDAWLERLRNDHIIEPYRQAVRFLHPSWTPQSDPSSHEPEPDRAPLSEPTVELRPRAFGALGEVAGPSVEQVAPDFPDSQDRPDSLGLPGSLDLPGSLGLPGSLDLPGGGDLEDVPATPQTPSAAARAIADARALLDNGKTWRATRALRRATSLGDPDERATAEAILGGLPIDRNWHYVAIGSFATIAVTTLLGFIWLWVTLPSTDETRALATSAHIHVRKAASEALALLGSRFDYSLNSSLDNISPHFVNAIIASEDHRFYQHGALYKISKFFQAGARCIFKKANVFAADRGCRGNSTIPQQLARNLFLSESRSIARKLKELVWALKMEWGLSKDEILEMYLNRVYLGEGNYGVEMASRSYFGKSASRLEIIESAYLAAAIKRPNWNYHGRRDKAAERAQLILRLMKNRGYVDPSLQMPYAFTPSLGERPPWKPYLGHLWQWLRPAIANALADQPPGDYKILTSLNAEVQIYAERHLSDEVERLHRRGVPVTQGAVVVMRPDGQVLAMVGGVGRDLTARGLNRAKRTTGLHTRPPASAFKPFVYLAALESGMDRATLIDASPISIPMPGAIDYAPGNHDGRTHEWVSVEDGLVNSINTASVRLLHDQLGFDALMDTLKRLGLPVESLRRQWGLALGASPIAPVEMASAYAVFANGGFATKPSGISMIFDESGKTIWHHSRGLGRRVFGAKVISELNHLLRQVVERGTGYRARHNLPASIQIAGKTGTGDSFVDAWFVGFGSGIVVCVWMGNDTPRSMPSLYGGTGPARVFNRIVHDLVEYTETGQWHQPLP